MREPLSNVERFSCVLETGSTYFIANITEKKVTTFIEKKSCSWNKNSKVHSISYYSLLAFHSLQNSTREGTLKNSLTAMPAWLPLVSFTYHKK